MAVDFHFPILHVVKMQQRSPSKPKSPLENSPTSTENEKNPETLPTKTVGPTILGKHGGPRTKLQGPTGDHGLSHGFWRR